MTTRLPEENIVPYGEEYVQSSDRHPAAFASEWLRRRGWDRRRIALELGSYYLGVPAARAFAAALGTEPLDGSLLVNWVRSIKSAAELAVMKEAGRIVETVMADALERARPGVREYDLVADICRAQIRGSGPDVPGFYTSTPPLVLSGERSVAPHLPWTGRVLERGQMTSLEIMGNRHRYQVPLGRSVFLGVPPASLVKRAEGAVTVLSETLSGIRPGMTAENVAELWRTGAERFGLAKEARVGYSIGIAYPPTGGELTVSLRRGDRTVLESGMCLHLIPALYAAEGSLVITEPFYLTATGAEPFCHLERRLFVRE